jgi:hypothetical protein
MSGVYNATGAAGETTSSSMGTLIGLAGASVGLMGAFFGVYLAQFLPEGTLSRFMPQNLLNSFRNDPIGSIRKLVNIVKDPKKAIKDAIASNTGVNLDNSVVTQDTPPIETKVELPQVDGNTPPPAVDPIPKIPTVLRPAFGIRR